MKKNLYIIVFITSQLLFGQTVDSLAYWINEFNKEIQPAQWSFILAKTSNDSILFSYNQNSTFIPASVQKLLTTAATLHMLGENFTYKTRFLLQGFKKDSSVWNGNLIILGGADPSLGIEEIDSLRWLDSLTQALKKMHVDSFTGKIIGIAAFVDSMIVPPSYSQEDMGNYFGAGTAGLMWNGNQVLLYFRTGKTGEPAILFKVEPDHPGTTWINRVKTGRLGSGDYTLVYGIPFEKKRIIEGTLPPHKDTFIVRAASPDPALYAALAIQQKLSEKGIKFKQTPTAYYNMPALKDTFFLYLHQSPLLLKLITFTNTSSHNVMAETLLKTLGKIKKKQGTYEAGIQIVQSFLKDSLHLPWSGKIVDGSGLSRQNLIKPIDQMKFLLAIKKMPWFNQFYSTLPIPGEKGTLKNYFLTSPLKTSLRAKTGTLKGVRTLSGYFTCRDEMYAFVFFVQGYSGNVFYVTKKMERLLDNIYKTLCHE